MNKNYHSHVILVRKLVLVVAAAAVTL